MHYNWVKWNRFLSHTTSFICSQIWLTVLYLCEYKLGFCLVLWRVYLGRIYSSITKKIEIWLLNRSHIKMKGDWWIIFFWENDSFEHVCWYSNNKADNYSSCLLLFLLEPVVYFHETDYYCIILGHYLQLVVGVLQNWCS